MCLSLAIIVHFCPVLTKSDYATVAMKKHPFRISFLLLLGLWMASCRVVHVADVQVTDFRIGESTPADSALLALIQPYQERVEKEMNVVIGKATVAMTKAQPEGTLGNWMADLVYRQGLQYDGGSIACALLNSGGIRMPGLSAGNITKGTVFELMPFDNQLVVVTLSGEVMMQLADRIAEKGGWPLSEGLSLTILDGRATEVQIQGQPLDMNGSYRVLLPDYVANGGDDCPFLIGQPQKQLGVFVRDAIIEAVLQDTRAGKDQEPGTLGRISKP